MKLSPHFSREEAEFSQTALRKGIDNTIPSNLMPAIITTAVHILEPVRVQFKTPFSPTSWYRCAKLNKAVGGSKKSQHTTGYAVDFKIPGHSTFEIATWIASNLKFDVLIAELYNSQNIDSGWVHCSYVHGANRGDVLRYDGKRYHKGLGGE